MWNDGNDAILQSYHVEASIHKDDSRIGNKVTI